MMADDTKTAALADTWRNCVEIMIDLPDEEGTTTMAMVPKGHVTATKDSVALPGIFLREGGIHVFALTAFDPPGEERTREQNLLQNARLQEDLGALPHQPVAIWGCVGMNVEQNWCEEGFCLAYTADVAEEARKEVLDVAVRFKQGAIFEYKAANEKELTRITLGACLPDSQVGATSSLVRTNKRFEPPVYSVPESRRGSDETRNYWQVQSARIASAKRRLTERRASDVAIPVINIGGYDTDDSARHSAIIDEVSFAVQSNGFMNILGHGIAPERIQEMFDLFEELQSLGEANLDELLSECGGQPNNLISRGLVANEKPNSLGDIREAQIESKLVMDFGPPGDDGPASNLYTSKIPDFREKVDRFYLELQRVERTMMKIFCEVLGRLFPSGAIDSLHLQKETQPARGLLRVNMYQDPLRSAGRCWCDAHTDWGLFTILMARCQGLEALIGKRWIRVPAIHGALTINVGDLLARVSSQTFTSCVHRVVSTGRPHRISLAYFSCEDLPAEEAPDENHISCVGPQIHAPITVREFLATRLSQKQAHHGDE